MSIEISDDHLLAAELAYFVRRLERGSMDAVEVLESLRIMIEALEGER